MKRLFLILIFSINWAIGIQAVDLPSTAQSLALSNTGIALPINTLINPSYNSDGKNSASFSTNYGLYDVVGKTISNQFGKHEISLNTFNTDVPIYGEEPALEPLGEAGLQFSCLSYRYLIGQSLKQNFGIKLKGVYLKLFPEHIYGLLFDIGFQRNINKYFNIGLTIKNVGHVVSDLPDSPLPYEYGLGFSFSPLNIILLADIIYHEIDKEAFKLGVITNSKIFNIYGSIVQFKTNRYLSTGFDMKYKNISFSYGIMFQEVKKLGISQSFQVSLYY